MEGLASSSGVNSDDVVVVEDNDSLFPPKPAGYNAVGKINFVGRGKLPALYSVVCVEGGEV
jgi:hypothetical protein